MKEVLPRSSLVQSMQSQLALTQQRHAGFPRDQAVLVRLIKLLHRLFNDSANTLLREHGLNHPEYNVLIMLDGSPQGLTPGELAEAAGEKSANTTRLVDQLLAKGLVTRTACEDDRRKLRVQLTAQGAWVIHRVMPAIAAQLQTFFGKLSGEQCATLEHLLLQVVEGIEGQP